MKIIICFAICISLLFVVGCSGFYKTEFGCPIENGNKIIILHFANNVNKEDALGLEGEATMSYSAHIGNINGEDFIKIITKDGAVLSLEGDMRRSEDQQLENLEKQIVEIINKPDPLGPFVTLSTEQPFDNSKYRMYLVRALKIVQRFNSK